ncbi:MAG: hypothetical protein WC322_03000, partial [Candidatus Paceibacterota bacterium]
MSTQGSYTGKAHKCPEPWDYPHSHNMTGLNSWEAGYKLTPCTELTHCPSFCDELADECTSVPKF